jgi:8-oxo-dGTP pyrophosphatase MutT (NUDIX family)
VENRQLVFQGRIIKLTLDQAELPNGKTAEFEIVHHPGGAAVVALDAEQRVCLLRQYRHAIQKWIWELPAGKLDAGEPPLTTAQRELLEETGANATRWTALGRMITSPGVFTEVVHLYLAQDITLSEAATEEHELLEVHWVAFPEALARAAAGDIEDGKTVVGLFRAINQLRVTKEIKR